MRFNSLLLSCVLLPVVACSPPIEEPNVVLILIDTLRADKLSSYGSPFDSSPALTRLVEDGVQFDSVLAQASWTLPSASSLLTSQYPRTLGIYGVDSGRIPDRFPTLAEALRGHGYTTFGTTANPNLNSRSAFDKGFDEYIDSNVVFKAAALEDGDGKVMYKDAKLHTAPELFDKALRFIHATDNRGPYFLQINVMEVHEHRYQKMLRKEFAKGFEESATTRYLQLIHQVTSDIEVFVGQLRDLEDWKDTLFVITSDHGEGLDDHPLVEGSDAHGRQLYDSQLFVPLLMFNDAWTFGPRRIAQRVRLLDLVPTILDLVDAPALTGVEGVSLVPLMTGEVESLELPDVLVTETHFRGADKLSIHGPDWQYIHNRDRAGQPDEHELQRQGETANGNATDKAADEPSEMRRLQLLLEEWEEGHPGNPSTPNFTKLSETEEQQLEDVGYIGED